MNKIYRLFLALFFLLGAVNGSMGQCANDNVLWIDITPPTCPGSEFTSCIFGGEYCTVSVVNGNTYTFQTCGDTDFDTQITIYNNGSGAFIAYNDDGCGLQSTITWTATFTGVVRVLVDQWNCVDQTTCMTLTVSCSPACASYNHPTTTLQNTNLGACMVNTCCANYYDNGGSGGNYSNDINGIYRTFCPSQPGNCIRAAFTSFDLNDVDGFWCSNLYGTGTDCCDELWILNGPTQNSTLLWGGCGTGSPGTITSTDGSGCLGFRFWSDGSVTRPGWAATLSCVSCAGGPSASEDNNCTASNAICGNSPVTGASTGPGLTSECSGCVISENYSNWYNIYIGANGTLALTINPVNNPDDYDFSLWGPGVGCGSVGSTSPVRCSYAANSGNTGMGNGAVDASEDVTGDGWVSTLGVTAGQSYILMVNNWSPGGSGFNLQWTGTASLGTPPGSVSVQTNNTCPGLNQGSACAVINAGLGPFTYSWSNGAGNVSCTNNLAPGSYTVTVTDGSGCISTATGTVVNSGSPTVSFTPTNATCPGTCNGSATASAAGGSSPYTFNWCCALGSGATKGGLCGGSSYSVTVTDANGCTGSNTVAIGNSSTNSTAPTGISSSAGTTICSGTSTTLTQTGGVLGTGAGYNWYTGGCGTTFIGSGASIVVTPASTTTYYVLATGTCNTTACASVTITVNSTSSAPTSISSSAGTTFCSGTSTTLSQNGGSLGSGAVYNWYTGSCGGTFIGSGASIVVTPVSTTTYFVRAQGSCNTTGCASLVININTTSTAAGSATASPNPVCAGNSTTLTANGGVLGSGANWQWYSGSCGGAFVGSGVNISVSPGSTTTYYVRAEGTCNTTACVFVTVTVNSTSTAAAFASASVNPLCSGNSTTLSANGGVLGAGANWQWYSSSCGVGFVGTGASLSVSPGSTTTYYVRAEGSCNTTACVSVTVTVNSSSTAATSASASTNPICAGNSTTLSAVGGILGTGANWQWYSGSCGGAFVGSGISVSVSPGATTTYFVRAEGTCNTTSCVSVTITVNTTSTAAGSASASVNPVCAGNTTTLSAVGGVLGSGAAWQWYSSSCGVGFVGSGVTLNVSPVATTTYYVRAEGSCNTTGCVSVTVTVNSSSTSPTSISATANPICPGNSTTLTQVGGVLGTGAVFQWYSGSCGGVFVGTGSSVTVSPAVSTTYFVRAEGTCNTTGCASLLITVNTLSTDPASASAAPNPVCAGNSTTLSVSGGFLGSGAAWQWYSSSCGVGFVGSGASLSVSPAVTTTYYVRAEGTCNTTNCSSVTVTVNSASVAAVSAGATDNPICAGNSTTLSVNPGFLGTGANWQWYSGSCGGTFVGTGLSVIVSPASSTTYYVRAEGTCNTTSCVSVSITVNTNSTAATSISATTNPICSGNSTTLSAVGGILGSGGAWQWYSGSCGGTFVGTGLSLSVSPASTTTYFVRAEGTCNTTSCVSLIVTVNSLSTDPSSAAASVNPLCQGNSTTLSVVGGLLGTGANWQWYSGSCGGVAVGSGTTLSVTPASTTTYYVRGEGTCNTTSCVSVTVTVNTNSTPPTSITASVNPTCPSQATTLTVVGGSLGSGADWQWYSGSCGGVFIGSGVSVAVLPAATTTYYVRADGTCNTTACTSLTINVTNTLSTDPTSASASVNPTCPSQSTTLTVAGGSLGTGAAWQWYSGSCGGTLVGAGSTLGVSPAVTTTYFVRGEGTCNSTACVSVTVNVTNTLSTDPTSISPSANPICPGNPTTLTVAGGSNGTGASWQWYTGSCGGTSAGTGSPLIVSPAVTTNYFVRSEGTCNTTTCVNLILTVTPQDDPSFSYTSNTYCETAADPIPTVTEIPPDGTFSGPVGIVFISTTTGQIDLSASTVGGPYSITYTTNGACPANSSFNITITPALTDASFSYSDPFCQGGVNPTPTGAGVGAGTFSATPAGLVFADANLGTIDLTATTPGSYTIQNLIPASGGCAADTAWQTIVINTAATVNAGADTTICAGSSYVLSGSIGGSASTGTWTNGGGDGTFTPNATTLTATYTPGIIDISMGSVTLTLTTDEPIGPCSAVSDLMVITIDPAATVDAGAIATICEGDNYTLSGTVGGGATSGTWTTGGDGNFSPDNVTLTASYIPGSNDISMGSVTLTLTTNDPAGPCAAVADNMVITINPAATANAGTDDTICASGCKTLSGAAGGGATSGLWTTAGDGFFDDVNILNATYCPGTNDILGGSVTLTLTTNDPLGPCPAVSDNVIISFDPVAIVNAGVDTVICAGSAYTLSGSVSGSASSGSWATSGDGTFNNSNLLNATYTPGANDILTGSVTLTLTSDDPAGPCPAVSASMTLTINAPATVTAGSDGSVCADSVFNLSGTIGGTATSATWSTAGNGIFGNATALNTTYTPGSNDISGGSVVLTLTTNDPSGPCPAAGSSIVLTITSLDNAAFAYSASTFCITGPDPAPTITGLPGGTFSGPVQVIFVSTLTGEINLSASTLGGPYTITYTTNGTCPNSSTFNVSITNSPDATFSYSDPFCETDLPNPVPTVVNAGVFTSTPAGLVFVSAITGEIDLAASTPGTYGVENYLAAGGGCSADSAFDVVIIDPAATADAGSGAAALCEGDTAFLSGSIGGSATTGTWSTSGDGIFDNATSLTAKYISGSSDISSGFVMLTLTTDDPAGSCIAVSDNIILTITQNDSAAFSYSSATACVTGSNPIPVITGTPGGTFTGPVEIVFVSTATGEINLVTSTLGGPYTITYTTSGVCPAASTFDISIVNGFDATFAYSNPYCQIGTATPTGAGVGQGTFSSTGGVVFLDAVNGVVDLGASSAGTQVITNDIPAQGGCAAATYTDNLIIEQSATVYAGPDVTICDIIYTISGSTMGGSATSVTWTTSGDGTFNDNTIIAPTYTAGVNDISVNSVILTVVTDDPSGVCPPDTDSMVLTLGDSAIVFAGNDDSLCTGDTAMITGTIGGSATSATWSTSGDGTFGDSSQLATIYIPGANDLLAGIVTLTLTTDDPAGPCNAASDEMIVLLLGPATVFAGADALICGSSYTVADATMGGSASSVTWTTMGDGIFTDPNQLNATYNLGANDIISGAVTLIITTDDPAGPCPGATDSMTITLSAPPFALAGTDDTICSGSTYTLAGSVGGIATSGVWSTLGDGTFDDDSLLAATYTPGANDIAFGSVILILTTDDPAGPCTAASDTILIIIEPAATADAGIAAATICAGDNYSLSASYGGSATSASWTTSGNGTFDDPNSSSATYTPGSIDISSGTVSLCYTTDDPPGSCLSASDCITITLNNLTTAYAGSDTIICAGTPAILSGTIGGGATSVTWTTSGDGSFSSSTSLITIYNPGTGDNTSGSVILTMTTDNPPGPCDSISDFLILTLLPAATVDAGSGQSLCGSNGYPVFLNVIKGGSTDNVLWTTTGTGVFDNPALINPIYTMSSADVTAGIVMIFVTGTDTVAGCTGKDTMIVSISGAPDPKIVATDTLICTNEIAVLTASGGTTYLWNTGSTSSVITVGVNQTDTFTVKVTNGACPPGGDTIIIYVLQEPDVQITSGEQTIIKEQTTQLNATGANTYNWTPAEYLNNANIADPIASPSDTVWFVVTGTDLVTGCSDRDSVRINVFGKSWIFVPNMISPNKDNENDRLNILGRGVTSLDFTLYDRWGEKIYELSDPNKINKNEGWDGSYRGKPVPPQVLVWYLSAKFLDGKKESYHGNTTLIR